MPEALNIIEEVGPAEAYRLLQSATDAALVDVRTRAEWAYVGLPDLAAIDRPVWRVEWVTFPAMTRNPGFVSDLLTCAEGQLPECLLFICRSGARSLAAARAVAESTAGAGGAPRCVNVAEGFEGDLDGEGHRGRVNGWKARGLPWRQS